MKIRVFYKAMLIVGVIIMCIGVNISAETLIFDPAINENWYAHGVFYGRGIQLKCDEAGENKGNIYATSEYYYYPGRYGNEHFPIFESRDMGKTYEHISDIYEKEFIQKKYMKAEDGTYYEVPLGTEGATTYYNEWWGMVFQPTLYELPEDIGNLKKGTVLCVGTATSSNHSAIVIYYSTDGLKTWEYLSTVSEGGKAKTENASAIWEGYLTAHEGTLYCFYSDERGMNQKGQKLVFKKTKDAINWSQDVAVCDFTEENPGFRPGMPVVTKLSDGRFMLVYEGVNMGTAGYLPNYYKITDDINNWDCKAHGNVMPRVFAGGSPYCTTMADGKIVVGGHNTSKVAVNTNSLSTNEWYIFDTGLQNAYSRSLFPLNNGELLVVSGGNYNETGARKLKSSTVMISIDEEIENITVTGTTPWGEESPNYDNSANNIIDGNINTFFDGLKDGYAIVDLGNEYNVSAIGYTTRENFAFRMDGGMFFGSLDGESWEKIYTINHVPTNGVIHYAEIEGGLYRYIKYTSNGTEACNIAEIKIYSSDELKVKMNGKPINLSNSGIIEKDGNVLVPLRIIAEEMGADVAWINSKRCAAIISNGKLSILYIDSKEYEFDGMKKIAAYQIELINGTAYIPLDVIEVILNCSTHIRGKTLNIIY